MTDIKTAEDPKVEHKKRGKPEFAADYGVEPHRAIVAVHPSGTAVAVAVAEELRIYDTRDGKIHTLMDKSSAGATVPRALAFSRCGRFFAAGGDDKLARLWTCDAWECIKTM